MKTSVLRLKTSLQDSIQKLLNKQIEMEAHSSAAYLSMAAWCYAQGLVGCGNRFKKQSGEEREHMLKIFDYVSDMGGMPISPEVKNIESNFENLRDILDKALEMEIAITFSINEITDACHKNKDFQTAKFLHWFLDEQMEEEQSARRCIEIYELIGIETDGLFRIDKEIEKVSAE